MQKQQQRQTPQKQRLFSASEVAEFEYCPLVWWYERFEPMAQADTEELFARLVELEHEHGPQAPALPEYQMVEQLLVREGAFETGKQQHSEHAEAVEEAEEEARRDIGITATAKMRTIALIAIVMVVLAMALIVAAVLIR